MHHRRDSNYYQTYVERDVRQLIHLKNASLFEKLMRLLAGRVGQLLDYSSLANDVGVDAKTIRHWISILEASFLLFRLPPYFENSGKRAIKSPKIYFTDVGLRRFRGIVPRFARGALIYSGDPLVLSDGTAVHNFREAAAWMPPEVRIPPPFTS